MAAPDRLWRAEIQIPAAQVGSGGVSNFTVFLTTASFITNAANMIDLDHADNAQSDAGDLIFTSDEAGENRIACHILRWTLNNTPSLSDCLVAVGPISLSSSTLNKIWVWYGHVSAQSQPAVGDAYGQYATYHSSVTGFYSAEAGSGSTIHDSTSNVRNGTHSNVVWQSGYKVGTGLQFNGSNADVSTSVAFSNYGSASKSIAAWVRVQGTAPSATPIYDGQCLVGDALGYFGLLRADSGGEQVWAYNYVGTVHSIGHTEQDNTWVRYVVTHNSTTLRLYADGSEVGNTASGTTDSLSNQLKLGKGYGNPYYEGDLDHVQLFNTELSVAHITTDYNNTNAPGTFATAQTPVFQGSATYTATAACTLAITSSSSSATFTAPTYTATAAPTVAAVTSASNAQFTAPTYTATATGTCVPTASAAEASFAPGTKTATVAAVSATVLCGVSATFVPGTKTATVAATTIATTSSSTASFSPGTHSASAICTVSVVTSTSSSTFSPGTKTASASGTIAVVTSQSSTTFIVPVYTASASCVSVPTTGQATAVFATVVFQASVIGTLSITTSASSASFSPPVFAANAACTQAIVISSSSATFATDTYTASATCMQIAVTSTSSASFTTPTYTATASLTVSSVQASASALFTAPTYTATVSSTVSNIQASASATFATIAPTVPGIEWAVPGDRLHWAVPGDRLHWAVPGDRLHWEVPEE